jgi:exonuclease III
MGRAEKVITIISVYQVCNNNRSSTTAYHQQQSALIQHGTSNPKPRKQFQNDLHQFLRTSQSNGESIILVGDFIMRTLTSAHPAQLGYAKTIRGTKRIDYYLISNTKYIEAMTAHLTKNNFYTNMTLLQSARDDNLAERLDDLLGQACLHAEKQCKLRVSLWWLRKLTQARLYQNFLY